MNATDQSFSVPLLDLAAVPDAGITGPKVGIRVPGTGQMRFPDQIDRELGILTESKNVGYQSWTSQLRDYAAIAADKGWTFNLVVRENTTLTQGVEAAKFRGDVNVFKDLPSK